MASFWKNTKEEVTAPGKYVQSTDNVSRPMAVLMTVFIVLVGFAVVFCLVYGSVWLAKKVNEEDKPTSVVTQPVNSGEESGNQSASSGSASNSSQSQQNSSNSSNTQTGASNSSNNSSSNSSRSSSSANQTPTTGSVPNTGPAPEELPNTGPQPE